MDKILQGVMHYNKSEKARFVNDWNRVKSHHIKAHTVLVSCMDCRVFPTKFTEAGVGEMYYMRNAGNFIPHHEDYKGGSVSTEGGGLELACVRSKIKDVIICGHSDCKAMGALYDIREKCDHKLYHEESPLKAWIALGGHRTAKRFCDLERRPGPMTMDVNLGQGLVRAVIDQDNRLPITDKLSLVNVLQQVDNADSYPFLQPLIKTGQVKVHAMWFDVHSGSVFMFSPSKQRFVMVDEASYNTLLHDAE